MPTHRRAAYIIVNRGDAVMNVHAAYPGGIPFTNLKFLDLPYHQKVHRIRSVMVQGGGDNEYAGIGYRDYWGQQWPANAIEFGRRNRYYTIHIQSDPNYCVNPSLFARMVHTDLAPNYTWYPQSHHWFRGPTMSVFCCGWHEDALAAVELLQQSIHGMPVVNIGAMCRNIEWCIMSPSMADSVYNGYAMGAPGVVHRLLDTPWTIEAKYDQSGGFMGDLLQPREGTYSVVVRDPAATSPRRPTSFIAEFLADVPISLFGTQAPEVMCTIPYQSAVSGLPYLYQLRQATRIVLSGTIHKPIVYLVMQNGKSRNIPGALVAAVIERYLKRKER